MGKCSWDTGMEAQIFKAFATIWGTNHSSRCIEYPSAKPKTQACSKVMAPRGPVSVPSRAPLYSGQYQSKPCGSRRWIPHGVPEVEHSNQEFLRY
ncbi:hypothetical protein PDIG_10590 [Penicillium digitatum PHI26]|uniref:Uncharacterized protein n=2 Tax=Penicillium digitatum TaxID=36651 RepID=K9G8F8_PEND2|nr:hypothetical protein PDIP_82100 [Penicillium digitatum Pd1]EKV05611.1 hypothetical protein PDIP_82100 [Penicillium digitatum Pd1]EKV18205.1 hypothetical protein PDIG_10590 [Penicillium digitatum PHI26]